MDIVISGLVGIVLGAVGAYFVIRNNRQYFLDIENGIVDVVDRLEELAEDVKELGSKV